ncbi:hypothetical protein SHAb15599_00041 [Acinetobacter phage SH-Ab 15599]|nr:hypothetical protein SHAb15599_00041 [Acinetobacter phage SH-Ab 15599]
MKYSAMKTLLESKGWNKPTLQFFGGGVQVHLSESSVSFKSQNKSALRLIQKAINDGGVMTDSVLSYQLQEDKDGDEDDEGEDGLTEATVRAGTFLAVLKGDEDFALYISDVQVQLYAGSKRPVGKRADIELCFDEKVINDLLKEAGKQQKAGKADAKPIETILKKHLNSGVKLVSVKAYGGV